MRKKGSLRYLLIAFFALLPIIWFIKNASTCDENAQRELIKTPDGKYIPKYKDVKDEVPFGKLTDQCDYVNNKIKCTDVRSKGNYVNRQSNLAIARMHAIFHLICQKYSIQYWLLSGSLLAARRDGVMIPWDTDGDIGMMLEDYQKLLKYVRLDLPDDIYFQDASDNPSFKRNVCNAKLRDRNSCYGHCVRTGCKWHDGLQIDIFVFQKSEKDPNMLESMFGKFRFPVNNILPTNLMKLEGVVVSGPANVHAVLVQQFGENYMKRPPKSVRCAYAGFIAIPWFSCEYINSQPVSVKNKILRDSMDHNNPWFWYVG